MKINQNSIKNTMQTGLLRLFHLLPVNKRKVLFQSYYGESYNDNPMMISRKLEGKGLDLVWAAARPLECPAVIRQVKMSSLRYFYELATAKVWVDNCRKRDWIRKKKGQYYIQTWHGNLGNKRTEGAAIDTLPPEYIARAKRDAGMTDLMISGSTFFTNLIREYFWYDGEILECGTPRLDDFFRYDSEKETAVRKALDIVPEARVVLYAPTFRENRETDCYQMAFESVLDAFEKKTGDPWVMLVRLHPNVADKADFIPCSSRIINATSYADLYELIPLADAVISDYSSLTFEAGLLDKPVFLFALDLESYIRERGFYIDIREQPYILAQSNGELVEKISGFDRDQYLEELHRFNRTLGISEKGNASEQIAERILEVTGK